MSGIGGLLRVYRRRHAREFVQRTQHDRLRRRAAHHTASVYLIPDLAVVIAGAFEQAGTSSSRVIDVHARQNPLQLTQNVAVEIRESRIFRGKKYSHAQWLLNAPERGFDYSART